MWVPPEAKDPMQLYASTRQSMACFGAVSLLTGKFVRSIVPKFNAVTFEAFLKKLLHKYQHILSLPFLPPYSPHLAPIKRV